MQSFALTTEYLTGYAVATMPFARQEAEWPPHPARVFMALAAAHFECNDPSVDLYAERQALDWLASLDPPKMNVPEVTSRIARTVYVPVNDQEGVEALAKRSKQPRYFPRVHVGDQPFQLIYSAPAEEIERHREALAQLCQRVTRIGHSSSLVWVRLETDTEFCVTHEPDDYALGRPARIVNVGAMSRLEQAYNLAAIDRYFDLRRKIDSAKAAAKKKLKQQLESEFPQGEPSSQRPVFSVSRPYRPVEAGRGATTTASPFDPNFIVLSTHDATTQLFGIESTAAFTKAFVGLLISRLESEGIPVPSWISGHESNGDPLRSSSHIALVPLAFVGRPWIEVERHARGQLMGLGLLIPREIPLRERARVLSKILFDDQYQPKPLDLRVGPDSELGVWSVVRDTTLEPKFTLRTTTYTQPSRCWASVTPVVLDRMPKSDRIAEPAAWREEVAGIICGSCENVGLPQPVSVRVEKTPFFIGSHRAMPGQGGFPLLRTGRFQVHVRLEFERPVSGPVLIGAGRFRGYGLLRPWREDWR